MFSENTKLFNALCYKCNQEDIKGEINTIVQQVYGHRELVFAQRVTPLDSTVTYGNDPCMVADVLAEENRLRALRHTSLPASSNFLVRSSAEQPVARLDSRSRRRSPSSEAKQFDLHMSSHQC